MGDPGSQPPLIAVVGPTAVGKTQIAVELAERLDGEIVSADSRLLYRGFDIGTAKPSADLRARVPHHLIDVAEPQAVWSLALYQQAALQAIAGIHARGRVPLLVGGTGQYVTAILDGWLPPQGAIDLTLRRELEAYAAEHGPEGLHRRLQQVDPVRAAALDPRNVRRVARALEIHQLTGRRPSELQGRQEPDFRSLRIGLQLPRTELYRRVDERIRRMLQGGLVDEVRGLLADGLPPDHPNMSAIGYRQVADYLLGRSSLGEAEAEMRRLTRRFVRRQANWFKSDDPRIVWFEVGADAVDTLAAKVSAWLRLD